MSKNVSLEMQLAYDAKHAISVVVEQLSSDAAHRVLAELREHLEHRAHQTRPYDTQEDDLL